MSEKNFDGVFAGKTPTDICNAYAAGRISKARLVRELVHYPYVPGGETDGYDSLIVDPPGVFAEVADARRSLVITDDIYEDVFFYRQQMREGTLAECHMYQERPYPFGMCETHDETFPLGEVCPAY